MNKLAISEVKLDSVDIDVLAIAIEVSMRYTSTSSYSIWSFMKVEAIRTGDTSRFMAYKNVNQRVVKLVNYGLLSKIKTADINIHGRKDYKLSDAGLTYLVPYFLAHPKKVKTLLRYMSEYELDIVRFGQLLRDGYTSAKETLNKYEFYMKSPDSVFKEEDRDDTDSDMIVTTVNRATKHKD